MRGSAGRRGCRGRPANFEQEPGLRTRPVECGALLFHQWRGPAGGEAGGSPRPIIGVLFDGFAYGMLLFLLSVGLSVTLGMMNFVNLAHCSFAMLGGYVTVTLTNSLGWPFLATLPMAFLAAAVVSVGVRAHAVPAALPRHRSRPVPADHRHRLHLGRGGGLYLRHHPAARDVPDYLRGSVTIMGQSFGVYRMFLIGVALVVTLVLVARSNTPASARRCAPRSTTSAWRAASASTSTASSP